MTGYNGITGPTPDRQRCDLNRESICFLCLEQSSTPELWFSLRSIYRYLSVNGEGIILARLSSELGEIGDTEKLIAKKMSLDSQTVVLCKQCASVIEPLIRLCMELELIQMRVHHYLKSVNGILECSQAMEDSTNHAELTRLMRKEMRHKCQIKLSQAVPKVVLTNDSSLLPENRILNVKTSAEIEYVKREFSPPLASDDDIGDIDSNREIFAQDEMSKCGYETLKMKMKKNAKHELCKLCRPPRKVHILKTNEHQVLFHLDNWFISSKQSNVTKEQFKEYCFHVLKVELISCETLSDGKGNVLAKCPHCPFSAKTGNNLRPLRCHVSAKHKKMISAKLEELQRSTTVEELRTFQFPPGVAFSLSDERADNYRKKAFKCDACDKVFHGFASLNKHKIMTHMNGLPEKRDWSCQDCGQDFKSGLILLRHRRKVHKMMHKCQICGKQFTRYSTLERHISGIHENSLPFQKCNDCGMEFKYRHGLLRHNQRMHGKPRLRDHSAIGSFKCDQCEKFFTHSRSLSRHKRKIHQNQETRVDLGMGWDGDTATATKFIKLRNVDQPTVVCKVEPVDKSETFDAIECAGHNDKCNKEQEAAEKEGVGGVNSDNEFDNHSQVSQVEMKILPDC